MKLVIFFICSILIDIIQIVLAMPIAYSKFFYKVTDMYFFTGVAVSISIKTILGSYKLLRDFTPALR